MYNVNNNHYDKSSVPHGIHSYSKLWWRMINSCLGQIVFDNIPHKCDMVLRYYHRGFEKSLNTKGWAMEYMTCYSNLWWSRSVVLAISFSTIFYTGVIWV